MQYTPTVLKDAKSVGLSVLVLANGTKWDALPGTSVHQDSLTRSFDLVLVLMTFMTRRCSQNTMVFRLCSPSCNACVLLNRRPWSPSGLMPRKPPL